MKEHLSEKEPIRQHPPEADESPDSSAEEHSLMSSLQDQVGNRAAQRLLADPGSPLEPTLRQDMEQRFGHDFSQVRVHSDAAAEQSAQDVNADAYTVGQDVVFSAGQFVPGTHEGRQLLAHELTHVVQQSGTDGGRVDQSNEKRGLSPDYSVIADAKDTAEVEADQVATRVASGQPAGPIRAPVANVLYAQPTHSPKPKNETHWEPEVEAETRSVHIGVGEKIPLKFRVSNRDTAPTGTIFNWRGIQLNESEAVSMVGFTDSYGARAALVVKGQTAGIAEVGTTLHFKTPGGQEDEESTPRVRVEVGPEIEAAQAELAQVEKLRAEGKEVSPSREAAAKQEAGAAAQKALGKASGAGGGEINLILGNVGQDISRIEQARYDGYQNALNDLNLTQLDEKEQEGNAKSFALSLAGNLIWALSGLIAITPVGLEATIAAGLLAKYGPQVGEKMAVELVPLLTQVRAVNSARLATAVGVGGAMLAQFASGLPSGSTEGGNVSGPLIKLRKELNNVNQELFKVTSFNLYSTLLRLVEIVPPDRDVDAQQYAGRLESGIRHLLFAGYYENGGATGNQVNPAAIQTDARNQLLRRMIVSSGKISGEGLASTKLDKRGLGKLVGPGVSLVGGAKALGLGDYELVVEQLKRAARELGLEGLPNVDAEQLRKDFAGSDNIILSAHVTDGGVAISNTARVMGRDVLEIDPYGVSPWITAVDYITIRKKDLTSANIGKGGALVYSADAFRIFAHGYLGAQHMEDESEQIQRGPVALQLTYHV